MITSKQRAYLRGLGNKLEAILQVGKSGVTPEMTQSVDEALEKRELIKISVLDNCEEEIPVVADMLKGRTRSEIVQVVGKKIILYRQSGTKPKIELPK